MIENKIVSINNKIHTLIIQQLKKLYNETDDLSK